MPQGMLQHVNGLCILCTFLQAAGIRTAVGVYCFDPVQQLS
jgi:hypothetical protein